MSDFKMSAKPGEVEFSKGLEGVIVGESTKSRVNGLEGKLYYLGIPIQELAKHSTYEETAFLLLHDRLPGQAELDQFSKTLASHRHVPDEILTNILKIADRDHPMALLRTAVSMLSAFDPGSEASDPEGMEEEAIKLISRMATIAAAIGRARKGLGAVPPREDLSHAANFLYMLQGEAPDDYAARVMDVLLILLADHGCNASTFVCIATTSTETDMISSVVAGICALKGPLHGGANERAVYMLDEIGIPDRAREYVEQALAEKRKVMGFGHRVYKTKDPRATMLQDYVRELAKRGGTQHYLEIADVVERTMVEKLGAKGIYPNVDFMSGVVMASLGIETALFTPIFAVSRVAGWTAHILEQRADNRIFRPRFIYTGPELGSPYIPLSERG